MISIIAAIGKNRELGANGKLIWKIPGDLPRFKKLTWGHPVIMGRKTYDTFQYKGGPLPGRTNIVITRDPNFSKEGFQVAHSYEEAVAIAKKSEGSEEIFVIGGGQIYALALPTADRLYLTVVEEHSEAADTYFPEYSEFTREIDHQEQTTDTLSFAYVTLEKTS